ncbi:MAG: type IV pilus twitching motility protein PilT [Ferrimicrobium sp.]|uniref:type IV pilus twitching motility protein PilT n=1 Tax=Ferrimicrobium sp. TaxID=2926050 RepID=UPI00261BE6D9|nr:PilT/PilU family type 4a pilus ATPase [Ferrimicrobium sp.]
MTYHPLLERYLDTLREQGGSDLHIKADAHVRVRISGRLQTLTSLPVPTAGDLSAMMETILPETAAASFKKTGETDFAYVDTHGRRYRVNCFVFGRAVGFAFRSVKPEAPSYTDLGLPASIANLAAIERGLILVTGPTGSGKSSTLAAIVNAINVTQAKHIITLEDPIEFTHRDQLSFINQREIGFDTRTFASALRASLRQDPDVILVGEMRDLETVEAAMQAAETGHLVLSTLHTLGVAETISRIIDFFPPYQQQQARVSLADILAGVISQRLVDAVAGTTLVAACEILVTNGRVKQAILEPDRATDLKTIVAEGAFYGMMTFDQALAQLVTEGKITAETALANASNSHDLGLILKDLGLTAT